jgi:hypothetical protein
MGRIRQKTSRRFLRTSKRRTRMRQLPAKPETNKGSTQDRTAQIQRQRGATGTSEQKIQTTMTERTAITIAPEVRDSDSMNAFMRAST